MEDGMILQLYWDRNEAAITETADKYGTYCNKVAANILSSHEDREECVNDTWLRTWNAIPPQRPNCLRMFLAKITRNLAFDRCKALSAKKRSGELEIALDELADCLTGGITAEDHAVGKELEKAINTFLKALPEREGNVFIRRYFFVETPADIGKRYGISAGNVAVILTRTRQKLRVYLQKEGYDA